MHTGAAINAGSPNQLNAWNYIKILLSEPIQTRVMGDRALIGWDAFPVNTAALNKEISATMQSGDMLGIADASGYYMYNAPAVPAGEKVPYAALHAGITNCSFKNAMLNNFFNTCMTPYFKGGKSLDDCITDLRNRLTLYVSE